MNAKDLLGKCARRSRDPYLGNVMIKDVSPYGHVQIEQKTDGTKETKWLSPQFFNNWDTCRDETWSQIGGRQLIGKCATRTKSMEGNNSFMDEAFFVTDVTDKGEIYGETVASGRNNLHRLDAKWNDGNWVMAPINMKCTRQYKF